jgi:myo-inositol 2-dehydrogenase / D-chiro-inositol 1-dehydrogenase
LSLRIGLIGVGRIGQQHAVSLAADSRVGELVITDLDSVRAVEVASLVGGRPVATVDELFALAPDAVVIASSTSTHVDLVLAGCARGIPVFCEKPCFTDADTGRRVVDEVDASGVSVHIGFQRRFDVGYRRAYEAVRDGSLGEVRRLHLVSADPTPPPAAYIAGSGGIHRDCQIHDADVLRWVSGREVSEVFALGASRGAEYIAAAGDADEVAAVLALDDGTLATLQASRYNGAGYDVRMELAGTAGTMAVGLDGRMPVRSAEANAPELSGPPWPGFLDRFAAAYRAEMAAFLTMVQDGAPSPCTVSDALSALLIADAVTRSRRERRPVPVDAAIAAQGLL